MTQRSLSSRFAAHFGSPPTIVAAAPGRINLIGEHTDYNEGFVLPASIDREAICALRQNDSSEYRLLAVDLNEQLECSSDALASTDKQWANYLLGVVDALQKLSHDVAGFDCAISCSVPSGTGLSSSAAITCAIATGLSALFDLKLDRWALVRVGQAAENDFVGANTGMLDQFASVFGKRDAALLLDCRSLEVKPYPIQLPGHQLVVLNTGVKHNHLTSGYGSRRADCERAVEQLQAAGWEGSSLRDLSLVALKQQRDHLDPTAYRRAKFIVAENARVLRAADQLERGDVTGFGESLLAGHWGLSRLYEVSCPESDAVVEFAQQHEACVGARQMGGGFGGCILCVVRDEAVHDFIDEAQQDYFDRFAITLEPLEVSIGPGARILLDARESPDDASSVLDFDNAPHRRLNILTGEWVLVSPHRAKRPWQGQTEDVSAESRPSYDPDCYLCPGNTRVGGEQNPKYPHTFVFTNDFAALKPGDATTSFSDGLLVAEAEPGTCRVLCYSPDHSKTMADMSVDELERVVELWQAQYAELGALDYINYVQIFENKGAAMGCSNPHPHGQIWSQYTAPDVVLTKGQRQRDYFQESDGLSLLSAYLEQEIAEETRIIYVDEHFVALVPWWAVWPFEVLIAPRRAMPHLGTLDTEEVRAFAKTLGEITRRYDRLFSTSFPYSSGIHQAPTDGGEHQYWHWHMEFKPPLLRSASIKKFMVGYELFATPQRDISPEEAAQRLRDA